MREFLVFLLGMTAGAGFLFGIQQLYSWLNRITKRVEYLRNEMYNLSKMQDDWKQFISWRNSNDN